jgi:hypothetical protein
MAWSLAQWQKAALVAVLLGGLFGFGVAVGDAATVAGDWIKELIGSQLAFIKLLATSGGVVAEFDVFTAGALGSFLPVTATVSAAAILYGLRKKLLYPVIDCLWPGFPSILQAALVTPGADPLLPSSDKTPAFVGRVEEIRMLRLFVEESTEKRPRIFLLTGPEGIGKTRLILTYLAELQKRGWDVGRLDLTLGATAVQKARFRRTTAILLDNPAESGQLTDLLAALAAHRQRLVVFVTMASGGLDLPVQQHHALTGLEAAELRAIAPGLSPLAETQAEGRPLFALLGENPLQALRKRAKDRLGRLDGNPGAARVLLLAALAGPLPHSDRKKLTPGDLSIPALQPIFGGLPQEAFRTQLPALTPTTMAAALLLAVLGRYPDGEFDDLLTQVAATYPEAMAQRLGLLWQWADLSPTETAHRDALQKIFDVAAPAWVEAAQAAAWAVVERTATEPTTPAEWQDFDQALASLAIAAAQRPFDGVIREVEARGAVNAMLHYGAARDFAGLEHWGARLIALAEHPTSGQVVAVRESEAKGAGGAMLPYGAAQDFVGLERWGTRLTALAEHATWGQVAAIRESEAKGAVNAILHYGAARDFSGLERWGARLIVLTEHPTWGRVSVIRESEAKGAVNAMDYYGRARDFSRLGRWGARLIALAEHPTLDQVSAIRECEAMGAANAIIHGHQTAVWRQRLAAVARRFPENLTIQDLANRYNLTYTAQRAQGWPFGPPPDANNKPPAADGT